MQLINGCYLNKMHYSVALDSTWNEKLIYKENKKSESRPKDSSFVKTTLENRKMAINIARESIVLLKNDNKLLPLKKEKIKTIAVIGESANIGNSNEKYHSEIRSLYEVTPLLGIKMKFGANTEVKWAKGYSTNPKEKIILFDEAINIAKDSDVVIFMTMKNHVKNDSELIYQKKLIKELANLNKNTVVVISEESSLGMNEWVDEVNTIVQTWYKGMEVGTALAEVLLGEVNPSGKLPVNLLEAKGRFPFGYGLSYTDFKYSDLKIIKNTNDGYINIRFNLTNIGKVSGAEVCEVYISNTMSLEEKKVRKLEVFEKIYLKPDEIKEVKFNLDMKSFEFREKEFSILIGSSSEDIRLVCKKCTV